MTLSLLLPLPKVHGCIAVKGSKPPSLKRFLSSNSIIFLLMHVLYGCGCPGYPSGSNLMQQKLVCRYSRGHLGLPPLFPPPFAHCICLLSPFPYPISRGSLMWLCFLLIVLCPSCLCMPTVFEYLDTRHDTSCMKQTADIGQISMVHSCRMALQLDSSCWRASMLFPCAAARQPCRPPRALLASWWRSCCT